MKTTLLIAAVGKALRELGPAKGDRILVGLSGGADSVALLDALRLLSAEWGHGIVAAHLNHGLRSDAEEDVAFCENLCSGWAVPLRVGRTDVGARARREGGGIEEAARLERYAFLRSVKEDFGAVAIAVAHTKDDQAETFLLRLLRGAGRAGLRSMRARQGDLWRPLLTVGRSCVLDHLHERGLPWREDPTNGDLAFRRNRVRHELLPYLESHFNPRIRETLARCAALLGEEAELLDVLGSELFVRAVRREGTRMVVSRRELGGAPRPLARLALRRALREAGGLQRVGVGHVEKILDVAASPASSGRRLPLPGNREAVVSFDDIRVGPRSGPPPVFAYSLPVPGRVELPGGLVLTAAPASGPQVAAAESAVVEMPEGPLVVRTRLPGDRMKTSGHEVSLKRVFCQEQVPVDLRPGLPLVASGKHVLWFPGRSGTLTAGHPNPQHSSAFRGTLGAGESVSAPPGRDGSGGPERLAPEGSGSGGRFVRLSIERP